jgi:hypothetical protein
MLLEVVKRKEKTVTHTAIKLPPYLLISYKCYIPQVKLQNVRREPSVKNPSLLRAVLEAFEWQDAVPGLPSSDLQVMPLIDGHKHHRQLVGHHCPNNTSVSR